MLRSNLRSLEASALARDRFFSIEGAESHDTFICPTKTGSLP